MKHVRSVWEDIASSSSEAKDLSRRAELMIVLGEFLDGLDHVVSGSRYGVDPGVLAHIKAGRIDRLSVPLLEQVMAAVVRVEGALPPADSHRALR